jgi:hypothetical protein
MRIDGSALHKVLVAVGLASKPPAVPEPSSVDLQDIDGLLTTPGADIGHAIRQAELADLDRLQVRLATEVEALPPPHGGHTDALPTATDARRAHLVAIQHLTYAVQTAKLADHRDPHAAQRQVERESSFISRAKPLHDTPGSSLTAMESLDIGAQERLVDVRADQVVVAEAHDAFAAAEAELAGARGTSREWDAQAGRDAAATRLDHAIVQMEQNGLGRIYDVVHGALQAIDDPLTSHDMKQAEMLSLVNHHLQAGAVLLAASSLAQCYPGGEEGGTLVNDFTGDLEQLVQRSALRQQLMTAGASDSGELCWSAKGLPKEGRTIQDNAALAALDQLQAGRAMAIGTYLAGSLLRGAEARAPDQAAMAGIPPTAHQHLQAGMDTMAQFDDVLEQSVAGRDAALSCFEDPAGLSEEMRALVPLAQKVAATYCLRLDEVTLPGGATPVGQLAANVAQYSPMLSGSPDERREAALRNALSPEAPARFFAT